MTFLLSNVWRTGTIALAIALAFVMWRADTISGQRDVLREGLTTEKKAHAITRDSVDLLQTKIAEQNDAIAVLEARGAQARENARKALGEAERANSRASRASERIRAEPSTDCETSEAILESGL